MKELAILLRKLQLFSHNCHNLVEGEDFLQYHSFLGDLYPAYEDAYDDIIERIIGLYGSENLDLLMIQEMAVSKLKEYPINASEPLEMFKVILHCEKEMCDYVNKLCRHPGVTEGTKQLIGSIADDSEKRQYKLKQTLKAPQHAVQIS